MLITFADPAGASQSFIEDTTIFLLIDYSGDWNGGFFTDASNVPTNGSRFPVGGQEWKIAYGLTSPVGLESLRGNSLPHSRFVAITAIPEPASLGLGALGWTMRRQRRMMP